MLPGWRVLHEPQGMVLEAHFSGRDLAPTASTPGRRRRDPGCARYAVIRWWYSGSSSAASSVTRTGANPPAHEKSRLSVHVTSAIFFV